jgi:hypothetical protein
LKPYWIILALGPCLLAACSQETDTGADNGAAMADHTEHHMVKISEREAADKAEAAKMLVERFDAGACTKADLVGTMRRTEPSGREQIVRGFSASVSCAEELTASVKRLGFGSDKSGVFASGPTAEVKEQVFIEIAEDSSGAMVEWEVDRR